MKMSAFILCLLCVVGSTTSNFINTVQREMKATASHGKPICTLDYKLTDCTPDTVSSATRVRPGTICNHGDINRYSLCQEDGRWRQITDKMKQDFDSKAIVKTRRKKRGFLIGAIVGAIACALFCKRGGGGGGGSPNSFPEIYCPTIPTQKPDIGTSMIVTWTEPIGKDKEDGQIKNVRRTGLPPGSEFDEGTHIISYHVTDKQGYPASCQIVFNVKVSYCSQLRWPRDGTRYCTNRDIAGSTCTFDCNKGYELQGSNSVQCSGGVWTGVIPKCQAKSCGPAPAVSNGALTCLGDTVYGTYCFLSCNRGYESQGLLMSMCSESGQWTQPGNCIREKDLSPPVFTFGCHDDITDYAEKKDQPKSVTWFDPEVTDNYNASAVTFTYNPQKGSAFSVGQTEVTVVATDPDGNTARCSFHITINSLHCPEPDLEDDKLLYNCSNGYGYGFSCSLSCHSGYPLKGSTSILCEKDDSVFPPTTSWTWPDDSIKPFCRTTTCPDLPLPKNGAMVCDAWTNGPMCVMMCNEEWDVPRNVPEQYACGEQTGNWQPSAIVYDCTVKRRAGQMRLLNEFYYFSGSCQDEDTRRAIAESFINILNTSTTFSDVCGPTVPECRPELVDVRCVETTRRRRGISHALFKKQTAEIIIEFSIDADFKEKPGETFTAARSRVESLLYSAIEAVDQMVSDGELDMEDKGVTVQANSYYPGVPDFYCDDGVADYEKGSCRGCPRGTYTDADTCVDCPVGAYNDVDFANSCKKCGEGTSTKSIRSTSVDNCTDLCPLGSYSSDGMVPCLPCDPGTYQDVLGSTSCQTCPDSTTSHQGASNVSHCVAFDLKITTEVMWGEVTADFTSLTLAYWFRVDASAGHTLSAVKDSQGSELLSVSATDSLFLKIAGNTVDTRAVPTTGRWQHLTLTIDGSTKRVTIYLNGNEVYTDTVTSLVDPVVPQGSNITSEATGGEILLSGISVVSRVVSPQEVQTSAGSCLTALSDSGFMFHRSGQNLVVPSLCDNVDGCAASPCGSNPCIDQIGDFTCDCQDGWTGTTCQTPPDYCANHICQNGAICENGNTNYTCACLKGFKGELCQEVIVNGQWSDWTKWPECSVTCGGGSKTRRRECDSPPPDDDGDDCHGAAEETVTCHSEPCPVCPTLALSLGNVLNCSLEEDLQKCTVTCRAGMVFADSDTMPPVYECGLTTGYNWNHPETYPKARPPACKKAVQASSYTGTNTVTYSNLPCDLASQKESEVMSQITTATSDLPCVKDGACSASSSILPCDHSTVQKRSVTMAKISINITAVMMTSVATDIDVFAHNGTITSNLQDYINKVLDTDATIQLLVNNSQMYLQLTLGGAIYNVDPDTMTTAAIIICPDGTVPAEGLCGECPAGTREEGNQCVWCERGTYQDQTASATCKLCPQGKTTLDTGATAVTDCSVDVDGKGNPGTDDRSVMLIALSLSIVSGLMLGIIGVFLICRTKICKNKAIGRPTSSRSVRKIQVQPINEAPPPYTEK